MKIFQADVNLVLARARKNNSSAKRSVLIAEDVKMTLRLTRESMCQVGFSCDLASDGQQAVQMATTNDYALILMDISMPCINGIEATSQIRKHEREQNAPYKLIYGFTSSCSENDLNVYNSVGMDGCFMKGCLLKEVIHQALNISRQQPNEFLFIDSKSLITNPRKHPLPASFLDSCTENDKKQEIPLHAAVFSPSKINAAIIASSLPSDSFNNKQHIRPLTTSIIRNSPSNIAGNPRSFPFFPKRPRALIVDDLRIVHHALRTALGKCGYDCDSAFDGETAFRLVQQNLHHFILMDVEVRLVFLKLLFIFVELYPDAKVRWV